MKLSTNSPTVKSKYYCIFGGVLVILLALVSLFVGKYPLSMQMLLSGDPMHWRVFLTLRCSRTLVGILGGFALGVAGLVYQTVFRNPLASADIIGVSSGASAGAGVGILFLSGAVSVTICAFAGALLALILVLGLSALDKSGKHQTIVLAGIAVHALAQTALMALKLTADPEQELAAIEYWIMGSLNGINIHSMVGSLLLCTACVIGLFLLHRQVVLLSSEEAEARMLGVNVLWLRLVILLVATLAVSSVVSLTGLISFVGLLAPHGARMLSRNNRGSTLLLSGFAGSILLCGADILARCVATVELPVSIFTSLIGAPVLVLLIIRGRRKP